MLNWRISLDIFCFKILKDRNIIKKGEKMDYYKKIKKELINNEVYKKVKDYSKNRSDLNT